MLLKSGKIYLVNFQDENSNNITKKRPVIILENIGEDKVKVIPLSSNINNARGKITINILLNDRVSYVTLLRDKVTTIPKSMIITEIGSISDNVMEKIRQMLLPSDIKESKTYSDSDTQEDIVISQKYMEDMKEYIIDTNQSVRRLISRKTAIMNIIVAIITGIVASLITNCIWLYITRTYNIH